MPITTTEFGDVKATVITGPHATRAFGYATLIRAIQLEGKHPGMRMTRGPSALARAKRITGLKTNNREVHIKWLQFIINEHMAKDAVTK
jgi:hypothetical protein